VAYDDSARLIWSLTTSGIGTTIAGNGNSGPYAAPAPGAPNALNARTAVDLRRADDLELMVYVTGKASTPALVVGLGIYDDQGNLYQPAAFQLTPTLTTVPVGSMLAIGRHAGSAGTYVTLPEWGQVYWTCSGGSVTGAEIALYVR
jgi:hypothetical protein